MPSSIMPVVFAPFVMIGMIFNFPILFVVAIPDNGLIVTAAEFSIFYFVCVVMHVRTRFIFYNFVAMVQIEVLIPCR